MSTSVHPLYQTQPVHSLQTQPTVRFSFQNGYQDLSHLAIFDYVKWSRSKGEEDHALFSLDSSSDNMNRTNGQFALTPNNLYLVRAYCDGGEIEMIFTIADPWNPILNLHIAEFPDGPAFVADESFEDLTRDEAELLSRSKHI